MIYRRFPAVRCQPQAIKIIWPRLQGWFKDGQMQVGFGGPADKVVGGTSCLSIFSRTRGSRTLPLIET